MKLIAQTLTRGLVGWYRSTPFCIRGEAREKAQNVALEEWHFKGGSVTWNQRRMECLRERGWSVEKNFGSKDGANLYFVSRKGQALIFQFPAEHPNLPDFKNLKYERLCRFKFNDRRRGTTGMTFTDYLVLDIPEHITSQH